MIEDIDPVTGMPVPKNRGGMPSRSINDLQQINTIQDSNGRKWEAQIDGTGTLDAHTSCVHSWNLAYTGPAGNRMRVTIKSA